MCALRGLPYENDTMDAVLNATIDAAIAMQQMVCAAEIMGLGCCHISHVRDHVDAIAEMLEIPGPRVPDIRALHRLPGARGLRQRPPLPSATIHTDRYDDGRLGDEINGYDRRRDRRYSIPAEKYKHPPLRHAEFYGWSEDKARQMAVDDGRTMRVYLEKAGFALG